MTAAVYRVEHETSYVHSGRVSTSQHVACLTPRTLPRQHRAIARTGDRACASQPRAAGRLFRQRRRPVHDSDPLQGDAGGRAERRRGDGDRAGRRGDARADADDDAGAGAGAVVRPRLSTPLATRASTTALPGKRYATRSSTSAGRRTSTRWSSAIPRLTSPRAPNLRRMPASRLRKIVRWSRRPWT